MSDSMLLGSDGKPVKRLEELPCPKCGAGRERRISSGGFGTPHLVCLGCGYEFEEKLKCPTVIS
jgi:hypothetical protein